MSLTAFAQWVPTAPAAGAPISYTNGSVGVGTTAPQTQLHVVSQSTAAFRGITNGQITNDATGGQFNFQKARGTLASPAAAVSGDAIGSVIPWAWDGSNWIGGARIRFTIDGTVASGSAPMNIQMFTGSANNGVERLRIDSAGHVGIGTTAPSYALDVAGTISSSTGGFRFPDGSVQTTAAAGSGTTTAANVTPGAFQSGAYSFPASLGVGIAAPANRLHVLSGGNDLSDGIRISGYDYATTGAYLMLNKNGGGGSVATIQAGDNNVYDPLRLNPYGGNVGVGTAAAPKRFTLQTLNNVTGAITSMASMATTS